MGNGMLKETKIINFFGGPGIGKSTQAAGLYSLIKKQIGKCFMK